VRDRPWPRQMLRMAYRVSRTAYSVSRAAYLVSRTVYLMSRTVYLMSRTAYRVSRTDDWTCRARPLCGGDGWVSTVARIHAPRPRRTDPVGRDPARGRQGRVGGLDKTERVAPEVIDVGAVLDAVAGAQAHGRVAIIG